VPAPEPAEAWGVPPSVRAGAACALGAAPSAGLVVPDVVGALVPGVAPDPAVVDACAVAGALEDKAAEEVPGATAAPAAGWVCPVLRGEVDDGRGRGLLVARDGIDGLGLALAAGGAASGADPDPNDHPSTLPGAGLYPPAPCWLYDHEPPRCAWK
jgi:hypothetical protein